MTLTLTLTPNSSSSHLLISSSPHPFFPVAAAFVPHALPLATELLTLTGLLKEDVLEGELGSLVTANY